MGEGRQVVQRMGPGSAQLNAMLEEIQKGMVFVTGYWFSEDMNWMDGELCGNGPEHCNMNPAYLSNWRLTTARRQFLPRQHQLQQAGSVAGVAARIATTIQATGATRISRAASHAMGNGVPRQYWSCFLLVLLLADVRSFNSGSRGFYA